MSCVFLQYLGSTRVTQTHGPGSTDDAVKKIVNDVSSNHFSTHFLSLTMIVCYCTCVTYGLACHNELPT